MENDKVTEEVNDELEKLHGKLTEELMEVNEIKGLNEEVYKNTTILEETTHGLEDTSRRTKWKWLMEYIKWIALGCIIGGILLLILLRPLFKK